ncbi:MAG: non-heme iron oxygenase ferredoxin subunit [Magnetococcales bacterium]|nr:non-heme iron oxygenase ferredoxin subunit [Magnetococcales bacterium]MBF0630693.1 non-heme iron oxygenase ferredoxin subunit [Magnetococcales bacterium]
MNEWVDVLPVAEFASGTWQTLMLEGQAVVVFHLDDGFYGLEDCCTHDGSDLSSGDVEGSDIICPLHGARFDIKTGAVLVPPAEEDVKVVAVRVDHGMVQVRRS